MDIKQKLVLLSSVIKQCCLIVLFIVLLVCINFTRKYMIITANDIKTKGVSYIDKMYKTAGQILISVRGKPKYAIIPIEEYEDMREDQISLAYKNAMEDIKNGDYHTNTEQFFKEVGIK